MRFPPDLTAPFEGRFQGHGQWHDVAGDAGPYTITQTLTPTDTGFDLAFTHVFPVDPDVNAAYAMEAVASHVFTVSAGGRALGHGHITEHLIQFFIRVGELLVETTIRPTPGGLLVSGFSTSNAKGLFTAWSEVHARAQG